MVENPYLKFRYIFDQFLAIIGLLLLSPVLLCVAILAKMDGGPAFFAQERLGQNGKSFRILKIRTMIVDADKYLDDQGRPTRKRITAIGNFLRKTSLDELPQLINVAKGEMALIGPRPILPSMEEYMTDRERRRFAIKPAVTGLAQIKGRNSLKWSRRFKFDVIYQKRAGLCLDILVVWRTLKMVFWASNIAADRNPGQVDDVRTRQLDSLRG